MMLIGQQNSVKRVLSSSYGHFLDTLGAFEIEIERNIIRVVPRVALNVALS